jgi:DnaJ-class molecular chaperone
MSKLIDINQPIFQFETCIECVGLGITSGLEMCKSCKGTGLKLLGTQDAAYVEFIHKSIRYK